MPVSLTTPPATARRLPPQFADAVPDRRQRGDERVVDEPLARRERAVEAVVHLHARAGDIAAALELARRQGATLFELRAALDDFELRGEPAALPLRRGQPNADRQRVPGSFPGRGGVWTRRPQYWRTMPPALRRNCLVIDLVLNRGSSATGNTTTTTTATLRPSCYLAAGPLTSPPVPTDGRFPPVSGPIHGPSPNQAISRSG